MQSLSDIDGPVWGSFAAMCAAVGFAVRWWYHTRKLAHVDKVDTSVSESLSFVLDAMRTELKRTHAEISALRVEQTTLTHRLYVCEERWAKLGQVGSAPAAEVARL